MRGEAFLALTGPAGSGKTTAAAAIRNELASRSVNVLLVHRGPDNTLRLRDIVSQVLDKPDTALNDDDIEKLFDVMTVRETPDRRVVLIIDDAELLQTSAMEYLHLLSSLVTTVAAQFIFVGRPEFWDNANHGATVQFKDLITARWELGPSSPDEILRFIEQTLSSRGLSVRETFDDDGLDALVRHSDGLFGRVLSLLSIAGNVQRQRHEIRLNPSAIDEAARRLAAGAVAQTDWDVPSARIEADNSTAAEDADIRAAAEDSAARNACGTAPRCRGLAGAGCRARNHGKHKHRNAGTNKAATVQLRDRIRGAVDRGRRGDILAGIGCCPPSRRIGTECYSRNNRRCRSAGDEYRRDVPVRRGPRKRDVGEQRHIGRGASAGATAVVANRKRCSDEFASGTAGATIASRGGSAG